MSIMEPILSSLGLGLAAIPAFYFYVALQEHDDRHQNVATDWPAHIGKLALYGVTSTFGIGLLIFVGVSNLTRFIPGLGDDTSSLIVSTFIALVLSSVIGFFLFYKRPADRYKVRQWQYEEQKRRLDISSAIVRRRSASN